MLLAKITGSNSHIDYVGRVIEDSDARPEDYGFAEFVSMPVEHETIVGVIYDSKLITPEYVNYGPRLAPRPPLDRFSSGHQNEQGVLIGILLLGSIRINGKSVHGVPRKIVPAGQDVMKITPDLLKRFHGLGNGSVNLHYYSQIVSHTDSLAIPLLEAIIERISGDCSEVDRQRLAVLKQSLVWQRTIGGMKL